MAVGCEKQSGFTFVFVLVALIVLGITAEVATYSSAMERKRTIEQELLYRGNAYYEAIRSYYYSSKPHRYPSSIDDLLYDPRFIHKRHLREAYLDPITGGDWKLLYTKEGRLIGVASHSEQPPVKQANFYSPYEHFQDSKRYSDWQFRFIERPIEQSQEQ